MKTWTISLALLAGGWMAIGGVTATDTAPSDWPQWRGPNRDGVAPSSPKLLDAWPTNGPALLWKSTEKIPSSRAGGCGSVSVADGRAFLFAHFNKQTSKFSISPGDLKAWGWSAEVPEDVAKKVDEAYTTFRGKLWGRGPTDAELEPLLASLTAEQLKKFKPLIEARFHQGYGLNWKVLNGLGELVNQEFDTFDAMGGAFKYRDDTGKPTYYEIFGVHNDNGGIVKGFLLAKCFAWTDTVYCFDAATGKTLWKKEFPGTAAAGNYYYAASCTPTIADGKCYVQGSAGLYCLDVKDGAVVWQAKTGFSNSSPLVKDNVVYVMAPQVSAFDARTGKQAWTNAAFQGGSVSVAMWTHAGKDYLIGTSGQDVFCVDPQTGKTVWQTFLSKLYGGGNDSTPVIVGDVLVMRGCSRLTAYQLTPEKAEPIWSKGCGDRGSTPVAYKDNVYTFGACNEGGEASSFACFDLKTGEMKWREKIAAHNETFSPVIADGKVFCHYYINNERLHSTIMFRATPDKFEKLGTFSEPLAEFVTPAVAGGRMFIRLKDAVACYELTGK